MPETLYFVTVAQYSGPRGVFCNRDGQGLACKDRPHTRDEIGEAMGAFDILLDPKSEPFTAETLALHSRWVPLAAYRNVWGIAYTLEGDRERLGQWRKQEDTNA